MREPQSFVSGAPVTHLKMEDQGDRELAVTNKSSLPHIRMLVEPPGQYFNSLQRHALALRSPVTIYERSPPSSPKSEPVLLTITTGATPRNLEWLNLAIHENSTRVHAPTSFTDLLQEFQMVELPSLLGSRTTIIEVTLRTLQSTGSINRDIGYQEIPTTGGR